MSINENNSPYNDVDFDEKVTWIISKWKECPDSSSFTKEIQMPTNLFQLNIYKDLSSNFKISAFIVKCAFSFPIQMTFIIYNHLNPDLNIKSTYCFIFTPSYQSISFDFNTKQKDIYNGYLDENDSLKIDIFFQHQSSRIHPTLQPETTQMVGLLENRSTFHFNNFLIMLFFIPKFKSCVFQANINENSPALYLQQIFSLLQFHQNPSIEISTDELIKSLNFTQLDFHNPDFLTLGVKFFNKIAPISYSLFKGVKLLCTKCKNVDFITRISEPFFGFNISIDGFDNLQDAVNNYATQNQKRDIEIDAGEFGLQEAEEYTIMSQLPSVLFFNLDRFYPDYIESTESNDNHNIQRFLKNNSPFSFNTFINLQSFFQNNLEIISETEKIPDNKDSKPPIYYLIGVMSHCGTSLEDGDFTCYVRQSISSDSNDWYSFNNNRVFNASKNQAIECNFGKDNQSAYILVYAKEQIFEEETYKIPENIRQYSTIYQLEMNKYLSGLHKFDLITPNLVEYNGSRGKLSLEESNSFLYVNPNSTLKDLYKKASEIIHLDESKFLLWIIENKNFIRKKIECTAKVSVKELIRNGFNDIFVQFLGQETEGDSIFLVFTYFRSYSPALRLMYTIAQSSDATFNDLIEEYCDITHCELSTHFTISYRVNDYEIKHIDEDKYDIKIKEFPDISSILVIQPSNLSNVFILRRPLYSKCQYAINYIDKFKTTPPNTVDDFLAMASTFKTIKVIKPLPTSTITSSSEISLQLCFPLTISFDNFKLFVTSSFTQNELSYQCFLFFPELNTKPLNFDSSTNVISMEEVFQTINFEKLYFYSFPFINFTCMKNVSRLFLIQKNGHNIITHFFRDDMPIFKVLEYAYQKKWVNCKEPNTLVYRKKNGLIESQVDPFSLAVNVKNPIYFCTYLDDNNQINPKDIFVPVEYIKVNQHSENYTEQNFLLKVIPGETFNNTLIRLTKIYGNLPPNCVYKIFDEKQGEAELEDESALSDEKNIILRIYSL